MESQKNRYPTYEAFCAQLRVSEAEAYDEPADPPTASIRQEDWSAKDQLNYIANMAEEISIVIEDGEQLEPVQRKMIQKMYDTLEQLKRQIEGREEIKSQEKEDQYDSIDNPNL